MLGRKRQHEELVRPAQAKKTRLQAKLDDTEGVTAVRSESSFNLDPLPDLLDFSFSKTEEEITERFSLIAKTLFHEHRLVVERQNDKEVKFEIMEAEFYLQIGDIHEDPFTHGTEEQKVSGRWYFHRAPRKSMDSRRSLTSLTGYRGGSRKGMDLTIGGPTPAVISKHFSPPAAASITATNSEELLLRGGILLRSLRQLGPNGKIISGPSLLVDHILNISGASSIQDLVQNKWGGDSSAFASNSNLGHATRLFLRPIIPLAIRKAPTTIYMSPRIGLDLSHPGTTPPTTLPLHPRIRFLSKPYRFFVHPEELVANGRSQTFLGVLQSCITSDYEDSLKKPHLTQELARLSGLKEPTSTRYLAEFVRGRAGGANLLKSFIGAKGKGASGSPVTYLKMMGALSVVSKQISD
ncbi:hypothetical protein B0H34DRAFT_255831 [Crassisporium funariophilum]|nr:hypothetical protein B0H34DRAFT_255831 [Crassisporium funariophilum]